MKMHRIIIGALLALMPLAMLMAKPTIQLAVPPIGQWYIEDLWKATLGNSGGDTGMVYFEGYAYDGGRQVFHATSKKLPLQPGTKVYGYRDVQIEHTDVARGYEAFVTRGGTLPAGSYSFKLLLMPFGVGDSFKFDVTPTGAPRLVSPRNGDTVGTRTPQFIWTPPSPAPKGRVTYELKLVQMMPGQTPEEAMRANRPWFSKPGITATSFAYPTAAPAFDSGAYVWSIACIQGASRTASSVSMMYLPGGITPPALTNIWGTIKRAGTGSELPGAAVQVYYPSMSIGGNQQKVWEGTSGVSGFYGYYETTVLEHNYFKMVVGKLGFKTKVRIGARKGEQNFVLNPGDPAVIEQEFVALERDPAQLAAVEFFKYPHDPDNMIPNPSFEVFEQVMSSPYPWCCKGWPFLPDWSNVFPWLSDDPTYVSEPEYFLAAANEWGNCSVHDQQLWPKKYYAGVEAFPYNDWIERHGGTGTSVGWHGEVLRARLVGPDGAPLDKLLSGQKLLFDFWACVPTGYTDKDGYTPDHMDLSQYLVYVYLRGNDGSDPIYVGSRGVAKPGKYGNWLEYNSNPDQPWVLSQQVDNPVIELRVARMDNKSRPGALLIDDLRLVKTN